MIIINTWVDGWTMGRVTDITAVLREYGRANVELAWSCIDRLVGMVTRQASADQWLASAIADQGPPTTSMIEAIRDNVHERYSALEKEASNADLAEAIEAALGTDGWAHGLPPRFGWQAHQAGDA